MADSFPSKSFAPGATASPASSADSLTIRQLISPAQRGMVVAGVLTFLAGVSSILPYVSLTEIARILLGGGHTPHVYYWVVLACASLFVSQITYGAGLGVSHVAEAKLRHILRMSLVNKLGRISLGAVDQTASGKIRKIVVDDTASIHTLVAHLAGDLVFSVTSLTTGLLYLTWVNWQFSMLLLLIWVVAMLLTTGLAMRGYDSLTREFADRQTELAGASVELLEGIKEIRNFQNSDVGKTRFHRARQAFSDTSFAWVHESGKFTAVSMGLLSPSSVFALLVPLSVWFTHQGWIEIAYVLPFFIIAPGLPMGLQALLSLTQHLYEARQAAADTAALLSVSDLPVEDVDAPVIEDAIAFQDVSFTYPDGTPAIKNLSLSVAIGQVVALVGPSGGGKSTLAKLIARFYDVSDGAVLVGGKDVRHQSQSDLLSQIAIVFQDVALSHDTIANNVAVGGVVDMERVVVAAQKAQIHDRIMRLPLGYDTVLDEGAGFLSGGEKQRLTIARAFYHDAPILILDEATAQADPHSESAIHQALSELSQGRTVVIIAHRLSTIVEADRIAVIVDGSLAEHGTHRELLQNGGLYSRLWNSQNSVQEAN